LGDVIESVYVAESPEAGVRDYNVLIVLREAVDEGIIDRIYLLSGKACEEASCEFAIVPKVVVKGTQEANEYERLLEEFGVKVL